MTLPPIISAKEVERRLPVIFPDGSERLTDCRSKAAARVIAAAIYVGAVEGSGIEIGPAHIVRLSEKQLSNKQAVADRQLYHKQIGGTYKAWYNENSRETVRDNVIKKSFIPIGAMTDREDLPTNAGSPRYALQAAFAKLFEPTVSDAQLKAMAEDWRANTLSPDALARIHLSQRSADAGGPLMKMADGTVQRLEPGPSSEIAIAVVERFAPRFLSKPVLAWLSQSGTKATFETRAIIQHLKLDIDEKKVLPDMILADLAEPFRLVFIEIVATDGPMSSARVKTLSSIALKGGFSSDQVYFVTAFKDRSGPAFRKAFASTAWGTMIWFSTEPDKLVILRAGKEDVLTMADDAPA